MASVPPTANEVMQSNDPEWLRQQADLVEAEAHAIAEELRKRAYLVDIVMGVAGHYTAVEMASDIVESAERGYLKATDAELEANYGITYEPTEMVVDKSLYARSCAVISSNKAIVAAKTRNAVLFRPSPYAVRCCERSVEILREGGSQRLHSRKLRAFDEVAFQ